MTIIDDYVDYCKTYIEKYGENTVVLLQCGDFFEIYSYIENNVTFGASMQRICDLCNFQMSRKNKSILENSRSNPMMAGFPLVALQKNIQLLVQHNYTIVVIRQVTPPPNVKREVTEIISPGTTLTTNTSEGIYCMTIYVEIHNMIPCIGICLMDVSTGTLLVKEIQGTTYDTTIASDEVYRLSQTYPPREVIFIGEQLEILEDIFDNVTVHKDWKNYDKCILTPSYQNTFLNKIFQGEDMLTACERIHMERMPWAMIALVKSIQFSYEHNDLTIKHLTYPVILDDSPHLILQYNSALQLNVISTQQGEKPLLSILNRCATAFGSRLFKERLMQPICEKNELMRRYEVVRNMLYEQTYLSIHREMSYMNDLERMMRRIQLGTFPMCELPNLSMSIGIAKNVLSNDEYKTILSLFEDELNTLFNLEECAKYTFVDAKTNIFNKGQYSHLDEMNDEIEKHQTFVQSLADKISSLQQGEATLCRVESNERDGYFLTTTKKRWQSATEQFKKNGIKADDYKTKPISATSTMIRITSHEIDEASDKMLLGMRKIMLKNQEAYKETLNNLSNKYSTNFKKIINELADLDVACTNAKNAFDFRYNEPTIQGEQSGFSAKAMRHPILERIHTSVEYTTNDIIMSQDGLLLFGINASGKSSLMKAIGLNVLMAQAGMYVPCSSFQYTPYKHLFTRISGNDNLYKGHSTFTVEMLELRNILRRANKNSLVLGDELCAGTEWISALAIVGAGIQTLSQKEATFVFATHLHELATMDAIKKCTNVRLAHMHIEVDACGKIIYDRILREGNGSEMYGLEVCGTLMLPAEFMQQAHQIRRTITNVPDKLVSNKVSRYNSQVTMDKCGICGKCATETHHIKMQKNAVDGYIEHQSMNRVSNLVPLCEMCHQSVHHGNLEIIGYKHTSNGNELNYKWVTPVVKEELLEINKLFQYIQKRFDGWFVRKSLRWKWKLIEDKEEIFRIVKSKIKGLTQDNLDIFLDGLSYNIQ